MKKSTNDRSNHLPNNQSHDRPNDRPNESRNECMNERTNETCNMYWKYMRLIPWTILDPLLVFLYPKIFWSLWPLGISDSFQYQLSIFFSIFGIPIMLEEMLLFHSFIVILVGKLAGFGGPHVWVLLSHSNLLKRFFSRAAGRNKPQTGNSTSQKFDSADMPGFQVFFC